MALFGLAGTLAGCTPEPVVPDEAQKPRGTAVDPVLRRFSFTALDGSLVSSSSLRGRMTVIIAMATYDDASHAQARFVKSVMHSHTPRINALALMLEHPQNQPLVQIFADSFALPFPVAMADEQIVAGQGDLPNMGQVPTIVLLDRKGREVWRHVGLIDTKALSEIIAEYDDQ